MKQVEIMMLPAEMGRDPEMADICNPQGIHWGWAAHVVVESDDGSRVAHNQGFTSFDEQDAAAQAEGLRGKVEAHLAVGGKLDMQHWHDLVPRYGSDAYIKGGHEQIQARREKEAG